MFDIGFSEIIVCGVVALVVLGPERLPEAVRTTGLWIGRFKRSLRETKADIERQIGVDDIRRQLHQEEMMRTLDSMQEEIETALNYERMGNKPVIEHNANTVEATPATPLIVEAIPVEEPIVISQPTPSTASIPSVSTQQLH